MNSITDVIKWIIHILKECTNACNDSINDSINYLILLSVPVIKRELERAKQFLMISDL